MAFIFAFFGILYYVIRASIENSEHKAYVRDAERRNKIFKEFLEDECNWEVEGDVKDKMRDPANAEWVREQTEDVLSRLPPLGLEVSARDARTLRWNEKLDIILAKQGHLRSTTSLYNPAPRYKRAAMLAEWICDELARHGRDVVIQRDSFYYNYMPRELVNEEDIVYSSPINAKGSQTLGMEYNTHL